LLSRLDVQARQVRSVRAVSRVTGDVPSTTATRVVIDLDPQIRGVYRGEAEHPGGHVEFRRTAEALYVKGDRVYWQAMEGFEDRPAAVDAVAGAFVEVPSERQPTGTLDTIAASGDFPGLARLIAAGADLPRPPADAGAPDEILLPAPEIMGGGVFHVPARGTDALPTLLTIPPHVEDGEPVPGVIVEWTRLDVPVRVEAPSPDTVVPWPAEALAR
jgi:hypothetical protein